MKKPIIIGITGGIGGGKSTFSQHLREQGQLVYDTDLEARKIQNESPIVRRKIIAEFGSDMYSDKGLERSKLAKVVFGDAGKLKKLNAIVHPAVKEHLNAWIKANTNHKILFMECAILFEGGFDDLVDKIVLVSAPEEVRIARVVKRDNVSAEHVKSRILHQWTDEEKARRADWIFDTSDDVHPNLRVDSFLKKIEQHDFESKK